MSVTEQQIARAASELRSQERYNPGWCKPGDESFGAHDGLYESRARMILEAAMGIKRADRPANGGIDVPF